MLKVTDLHFEFPKTVALDGVTLEIQAQQLVSLLGPSGCGKTTFLRVIAGFEQVQRGEIQIAGEVVASSKVHLGSHQRRIGMVFQNYALFPHLTVWENIVFGGPLSGDKEKRGRELLELFEIGPLAKKFPHQLSGGEQQRVALARALLPAPQLLLLDEPFSNLDYELRARLVMDVRERLRALKVTALMVTHSPVEAMDFSDEIIAMDHGQIQQKGTSDELYWHPESAAVAELFGPVNYLSATLEEPAVARSAFGVHGLKAAPGSIGQRVRLVVRPEQLVFGATGPVAVRCRRILNRGSYTLVETQAESGDVYLVHRSAREGKILVGQEGWLSFDPQGRYVQAFEVSFKPTSETSSNPKKNNR